MKVGLVSYEFKNRDIAFNFAQIERAMKAARGRAEILCFGEAFLQGFDALEWKYEQDKQMAISVHSKIMQKICKLTLQYEVDLLLGYIESENDKIFSSCVFIERGKIIQNYRRITRGWKEYTKTDGHYKEGMESFETVYRGRNIRIALCGDMWEIPEKFITDDILIWPVYVNFTLEEWKTYEMEYAKQANRVSNCTLMVNSISKNPQAHGGAFYFRGEKTVSKLAHDTEAILYVEV